MKPMPPVTLALAAFLITACSASTDSPTTPDESSSVSTIEIDSRDHVDEDLEYPQSPPIGGDHSAAWQNCGVYRDPVLDETAVHSLEHGAVWITYRPDLTPADIEVLEGLADGQTHLLVSPYPGLSAPIVAGAWGAQQSFQSVDDEGIRQFIATFQQGAQTPEPGAPCSGGFGEPD